MNSIDAMSELQALPRRLDAILAAAGITDARVATINGAPATASLTLCLPVYLPVCMCLCL